MDCTFCAIVAGTEPAHLIDGDAATIAFLDIAPFARGHTLVIPRRHADDLWDIEEDTAAHVMRAAHRVARRLRRALEPDGMNLLQSTRRAAFQTEFHLHVHVIPRWSGDALVPPPWPKPRVARAELEELAEHVRSSTDGTGESAWSEP